MKTLVCQPSSRSLTRSAGFCKEWLCPFELPGPELAMPGKAAHHRGAPWPLWLPRVQSVFLNSAPLVSDLGVRVGIFWTR